MLLLLLLVRLRLMKHLLGVHHMVLLLLVMTGAIHQMSEIKRAAAASLGVLLHHLRIKRSSAAHSAPVGKFIPVYISAGISTSLNLIPERSQQGWINARGLLWLRLRLWVLLLYREAIHS